MTSTTVSRKKIENYSYIINNSIGKGYSSQVFKGRNDLTNQNVAIKVIDLKQLKNEINTILLQSQIAILKELKSLPNILHLHDVFTTKNNTYIITELCEHDFGKEIKKRKMSEGQVFAYMDQIISGYLNFARKDIIHRDLKPANILVSSSGLKIADFGFAIKSCDAHKYSKYNVGSPLYMAPESLKRNEYSLESDIWALGIIFYEMLTGNTPWKAKNQKDLLKKIESQSIDDILQIMSVSNMSKSFLRKSLRVDRKTRLTVQDLADYRFNNAGGLRSQSLLENVLGEKKTNVRVVAHQKSLTVFGDHLSQRMVCKTPSHQQRQREKDKLNCLQDNQMKKSDATNENTTIKIQIKSPNQPQSSSLKSINFLNFGQSAKKAQNHQKENSNLSEMMHYKSTTMMAPQHNPQRQTSINMTTTLTSTFNLQKKTTTKILISEIHFCRFLYKLMSKILESHTKKGLLQYSKAQVQRIMCNYVGIIKYKLQNVLSFNLVNFLNLTHYEQYKKSSDFQKILKITKEYRNRYTKDLMIYWSTSALSFSTQPTTQMITHLFNLLSLRKDAQESVIGRYDRQVIILDYLMTAKSLLGYFKDVKGTSSDSKDMKLGQGLQKFARKSKIEDIVEGKCMEITLELFQKIMQRARVNSSDHDYSNKNKQYENQYEQQQRLDRCQLQKGQQLCRGDAASVRV